MPSIKGCNITLGGKNNFFKLGIDAFALEKGDIIFVFGESGSGKTTFFNVLSGVIPSDVSCSVRQYFPKIDYILHESKLLPWKNLRDNVRLINKICGSIDIEKLSAICVAMGLDKNFLDKRPWQLSQGMRQRIEIAIAVANNSDLIILDEALSGIDYKNKLKTCDILHNYVKKSNAALLLTAHHAADMLRLAKKIFFMDQGKIVSAIEVNSISLEERIFASTSELFAMKEAGWIDRMQAGVPNARKACCTACAATDVAKM